VWKLGLVVVWVGWSGVGWRGRVVGGWLVGIVRWGVLVWVIRVVVHGTLGITAILLCDCLVKDYTYHI
jgi:hypothetical protein